MRRSVNPRPKGGRTGSPRPRLRCFMAMAIRRGEDTDGVYFRQIKPALGRIGVRAFRIDEIHHLENIDQRILREIDRSDLVVADLSYERPSVYFEAGYAEKKGIPVVYTCRTDHLSPRTSTAPRVHFDVRQRPIVDWPRPDDPRFADRLAARVRAVIAPLVRSQKAINRRRQEEASFAALSREERQRRLFRAGEYFALGAGFRSGPECDLARANVAWSGYSLLKTGVKTLLLWVAAGFDRRALCVVQSAWFAYRLLEDAVPKEAPREWRSEHVILVCLWPVPSSRVEFVFSDFSKEVTGPERSWVQVQPGCRRRLWMIDSVRSEAEFRERGGPVFQHIRGLRRRMDKEPRKGG